MTKPRASLHVTYVGGSTYTYYRVPKQVLSGVRAAPSKGQYVNQFVKNRLRLPQARALGVKRHFAPRRPGRVVLPASSATRSRNPSPREIAVDRGEAHIGDIVRVRADETSRPRDRFRRDLASPSFPVPARF